MIRSKVHKGLQRRGNTRIDSSILLEQTGPMELAVRAGEFVDVQGNVYALPSDSVISLTSTTDKKYVSAWLTTTDGKTLQVETRELTQAQLNAGEAASALNGEPVERLLGWDWCIISANASSLPDPVHTKTYIDNVGVRRKPDGSVVFYGRGEETGNEHEFDEMEHFAQRKGQGGVFLMCPKCGKVDDDKEILSSVKGSKCGFCEHKDTVKVKDCE